AAEDACGKAPPELQRIDKRPVDPALRALKTEQAMARAEVSRLERRQPRDEAAIGRAQARLAEAERRLGEHPEA
ncbi:electron transporter RnfB, partial [Metapseudomonas otitidis]